MLEVSILAQSATRVGARMIGARRGTGPDDSKGPMLSRLGIPPLPALRLGFLIAGAAGALALAAATFATVIEIRVGTTTKLVQAQTVFSGWDRHGPALLLLAAFAAVLLVGAARGSRPAMIAVLVCGVAALAIALIWDLPDVHDTGSVGDLYSDASASPKAGYYLETAGGALLLLSGGGLLLAWSREAEPRPRVRAERPPADEVAGEA